MRVLNLKFFKNMMKNLFFYSVGSGYNFNIYRGGGLEAYSSAFRFYSLAYFIVLAIKHQVSKSFTSRLSILGVHSGPFVCLFYTKSDIVFGERLLWIFSPLQCFRRLFPVVVRDFFVSSSHFYARQIHFKFIGALSQEKKTSFPRRGAFWGFFKNLSKKRLTFFPGCIKTFACAKKTVRTRFVFGEKSQSFLPGVSSRVWSSLLTFLGS